MTIPTIAKILLNTALGVILITIWLQFVNLSQIWATIQSVNILKLAPVFLFMFLSALARALRFNIFLSEIKDIKLLPLFWLTGLSMMLNFFIPIRAGEVAKGIYLATRYHLPLGKSVIWVFLDRFLDFLVMLAVAAVLLLIVPTALSINIVIVITVILTIALILTCLAVYRLDFSKNLVNFLKYLLIVNPIKIYFERYSYFILNSFSILRRHPKDLALLGAVTVLAYGADASIWYFTFVALGFPQDFIKMYLGQLLSALTYLIPAAPGYVGSAEASGTLILSGVFGLPTNLASAMIVLFHIASALFILVFGLISVFSLKIDLGLILKKALRKGD